MNLFTKGTRWISGAARAVQEEDAESGLAFDRRKHERVQTDLLGSVKVAGTSRSTRISDISCGGLRLSDFGEVNVGEDITIELDEGSSMKGKIVWSSDGEAGVQFESDMDKEHALLKKDK